MVDMVEIHYDAIPDGLLSEIRSLTGHLCDATIRKDLPLENRLANVNSANTHMRRILLDCYKLMCIWHRSHIHAFDRKYFFLDWASVSDGDFIREHSTLKKTARRKFKKAKKLERPGKNDREQEDEPGEVYIAYMEAFNAYIAIETHIEENQDRIDRASQKYLVKTIISALGWVISVIISIVFGLISMK